MGRDSTPDPMEIRARKKYFQAVGKYLQARREKANITRKEIAAASGCTIQFISNIERGASFPPVTLLRKMTELYRIDEGDFLAMVMTLQHDFFKTAVFQGATLKRRA